MNLRLIHILIYSFVGMLFTSCSLVTDGQTEDLAAIDSDRSYINITIAVTSSDQRTTRANTPTGGENGDGREAGFERENAITGITLILYKADNGINTTSSAPLELVRYLPVTRVSRENEGSISTGKYIESVYTTGNQFIGKTFSGKLSGTYHAIVVANIDLTNVFREGIDGINQVKNYRLTDFCSGDVRTLPVQNLAGFVMSSESDYSFEIGNEEQVTETVMSDGDVLFELKEPICIERMAARLDFWADNSEGYNETYGKKGYVYKVKNDAGMETADRFVVTGFMPFNLPHGYINRYEYLLKRVGSANKSNIVYLGDETTTNYVIDPNEKPSSYTDNTLNSLHWLLPKSVQTLESNTSYYRSAETLHQAVTEGLSAGYANLESSGSEDVVIYYLMENTLMPEDRLYTYATGLAIIGYYYENGTGPGTPYVYCGYLRHQGEAETYEIKSRDKATFSTTETTQSLGGPPMNFGVVRNNIYRISINNVTQKGELQLRIVVKKWDPFTHETIYM